MSKVLEDGQHVRVPLILADALPRLLTLADTFVYADTVPGAWRDEARAIAKAHRAAPDRARLLRNLDAFARRAQGRADEARAHGIAGSALDDAVAAAEWAKSALAQAREPADDGRAAAMADRQRGAAMMARALHLNEIGNAWRGDS